MHTERITTQRGYEAIFVHGAVASTLAAYLNPEVEFVWILGHMPNRRVEWWSAVAPLSCSQNIFAKIRSLSYDLQLTTKEFLDHAESFDDHGLALIQSHRPMPDTLNLARIPDAMQDAVLIKNGAFLRIWLPHAVETALVTCYESGYLDAIDG
jgi:hypothetical protein